MLELLEWFMHNNVVQGLILVGILWLVARDEANLDLGNMCALLFFSFALGWAAVMFLYPVAGIFGILAKPVIFVLLIKYMCWVRYRIAFVATGIFIVFTVMLNTVLVLGYFVGEAKADGDHGNLMTFAQHYVVNQFSETEEWEADEGVPEETSVADEPEESVNPDPGGYAVNRGKTQVAGVVPAPENQSASVITSPEAAAAADPEELAVEPEMDEGWIRSRRKIIVTGQFTGAKGKVAMVDNEMIGAGNTVKVTYKGDSYTWRLKAFEEHRIVWEPVYP